MLNGIILIGSKLVPESIIKNKKNNQQVFHGFQFFVLNVKLELFDPNQMHY